MEIIKLDSLYKEFQDVTAVNKISLTIEEGEFLSLLGPSGCGKTTTLRMIAGFETPTKGNIFLRGQKIDDKSPRERNIGMVFQNYALFPHMNIYENIAFGLKMRNVDEKDIRKEVSRYLELVKLPGYEKRLPRQLSGGQQQRIALARALIIQPEVVLLDEPFGALDRKLREAMQLEVKSILTDLHITTIYVTHDQDEALVMSDKIAVMNQGVIEQVDAPQDIYESPKTEFVANFIGVSNVFKGEVSAVTKNRQQVITKTGLEIVVEDNTKKKGEDITFTVRPENISLCPGENDDEENIFAAKIKNVKYLGNVTQYYLNMQDKKIVTLISQNSREQKNNYNIGDAVYIKLPSNSFNII